MTVIYSNFEDPDTQVLRKMWEGLGAKVVELTADNKVPAYKINQIISEEKDTLILCGHGTHYGMWDPYGHFAFDSSSIPFIKAKNVIGIWCHAREFSKENDFPGFFSSMFISNSGEAWTQGIKGVPDRVITRSEIIFCKKVNTLLKNNVPLEKWVDTIQSDLLNKDSNEVEEFNYSNLYYKGV